MVREAGVRDVERFIERGDVREKETGVAVEKCG